MSEKGAVTRGGKKRKRADKAFCKQQAKDGLINKADGNWRKATDSKADTMNIRGSVG